MEPLKLLRSYGITPKAILHIGAHWGQEAAEYQANGAKKVIFVEAIPQIFEQLRQNMEDYPGFRAVCALCSDKSGKTVDFHVASNDGGSSSMLELGTHADLYPDIRFVETLHLTTITADDLIRKIAPGQPIDLLVLDTQGSELTVLRGARDLLRRTKALLIEVNDEPLYKGCASFEQVTEFLRPLGFRLRYTRIRRQGWGDALYIRTGDSEQSVSGSPLLNLVAAHLVPARLKRWMRRRAIEREIKELQDSPLFDREWYLANYPDVRASGLDPVRHYVEHGRRERRDPAP